MTLEEFVVASLEDKSLDDFMEFDLPQKAIEKAWKLKFIDLRGYKCVIRSREIRHVYNEHGDDVYLINDICKLLESFWHIERSVVEDEKTKKPVTSIVFKKRTNTNEIKIVKTNLSRKKILRLKTLFVME